MFSTEMESVLPRRSHVLTVGKDKGQIFISEEEVILEADFLGQETPPETPQSLEQQNLSKQVEELQRANQELHREKKELRRENQAFCRENQELKSQRKEIEQLQGLDQQRIHKLEQEVEEKARDMEERKQEVEEKKREVGHLQQELQREQERSARLQERLDQSTAELEQMKPTTALLNSVQFNTASRSEVQVQGNIGEGAWGVVARGQFNGQAVAIKWPHVALLKQYPNTVGRMRREVQIMSQVRHPNLVRFIAAVLDEAAEQLRASPMIITELLDTNLRIAYQEGRLQEAHCTPILCDVAFALHYLHDHLPPIIHRDVSTPNILLQALPNRGWLAKVSDFGSANLAKLARTAGEGAIVYTAPEAFPHMDEDTEPPEMTTKMDVFSYGVLMCEVLSREPPFSHNYLRNMLQQLQHRPEHGLVSRCTRRSPGDRPSMAGVLDELYKLPRPLPTPS